MTKAQRVLRSATLGALFGGAATWGMSEIILLRPFSPEHGALVERVQVVSIAMAAGLIAALWAWIEWSDEPQRRRPTIEEIVAENRRLVRERGNALYMCEAYRQMLGPKGREVAALWAAKGLVRQHTSWATDPYTMHGEDVAQLHLDFEAAPKHTLTPEELAQL